MQQNVSVVLFISISLMKTLVQFKKSTCLPTLPDLNLRKSLLPVWSSLTSGEDHIPFRIPDGDDYMYNCTMYIGLLWHRLLLNLKNKKFQWLTPQFVFLLTFDSYVLYVA